MFGNISIADGLSMAWIQGLAHVHSLSTNCLPPSQLVSLPRLTFLGFGLQNCQIHQVPPLVQLPESTSINAAPPMKRMRVLLDVDCLHENVEPVDDEIYRYVQQLPDRLPHLTSLDLLIKPVFRNSEDWHDHVWKRGSYDCLVAKLRVHNIEILKLDTSAISSPDEPLYEDYYNGSHRGSLGWAQHLRPIVSLTDIAKLRKIVAAQEAFFSVDEEFSVCRFPSSIEEISIIDTTNAVDRWLNHVYTSIQEYPNLQVNTLWARRRYNPRFELDSRDGHFSWDPHLGNENDFPWEDDELDDEHSEMTDSEMAQAVRHDGKEQEVEGLEDGEGGYDDTNTQCGLNTPSPPQWKQDFVAATRDRSVWFGLQAAGIELKGEWRYYSDWDGYAWTDL
ncbi:Nn.00g117030.m01.CDS01 [Neocucurbitaria sp. VM-36]